MKMRLTLLLLLFSLTAQAQWFWSESFEAPSDAYRSRFTIDTTNYHHNIWQIGRPHKTIFDTLSPLSPPHVIVTDTLNPYPPNDTSVFIVSHYYMASPGFTLSFYYKLDIDSGTIAKVEISGDSGRHWINPLTEDTTYMFYWGFSGKPRLDTSFHTWQNFSLGMNPWANAYPGGPDSFPQYRTSDTILFRFTFISNSDTIHKDGWMMDNFMVGNAVMEGGISQVMNNDLINIYPIPSSGPIYIHSNEPSAEKATITIFNSKGDLVYTSENIPYSTQLNLNLPDGNYYLKYQLGKTYALKRLVIIK